MRLFFHTRLKVWALFALLWLPLTLAAHVGSPNVIYEGLAGSYHVRVVVRPPTVVPGLAEISVRVVSGDATRVTVLPVRWDAGTKGAPPPDEAKPVRGDPKLFAAELWLMTSGAYSIFVNVEGAQGSGTTVVPINSVATTRLAMPRWFGGLLLALAAFLFVALITIVGAAARESVLQPGQEPDRRARRRAVFAMIMAILVLSLGLYGGRKWWNAVDADYRSNKIYRADSISTAIRENGTQRVLHLEMAETRWGRRPLVTEHGKLMHLFLVHTNGMNGFAHLHPALAGTNVFEAVLPSLPAGRYSVYADVTHESGFTQTMTSEIDLAEKSALDHSTVALDPNDGWFVSEAGGGLTNTFALAKDLTLAWERPDALIENRDATLRFRVLDASHKPALLEPYLGMQAHAVIRHEDGSVFTHLHPFGTISMTAQQLFVKRERDVAPNRKSLEVLCGLPPNDDFISFPYAFPRPGRYRIWVQVKSLGAIRTGCFDADVRKSGG